MAMKTVMWNNMNGLKCCIGTAWGSFQLVSIGKPSAVLPPENKITEKQKFSPFAYLKLCVCVCQ